MTNEEEKSRALQLKQMRLDWKTARFAPKGHPRYNQVPGQVCILVEDKDGNEMPYMCSEKDIPNEAKKYLKVEESAADPE